MRPGRLFWREFRNWDRASQMAFGIALLLLILAAVTLAVGPETVSQPALIGFVGLVIAAQAIFMWANRGMVTAYTQAQRLYLAGDFEAACALLENGRAAGKANFRALTLLGNAYRQRSLLDESETVLREALALQPDHHFSLYGFGRTLLIQGRYAEAAQVFQQALAVGAPPVAQLDAADACYRNGQLDEARRLVEAILPAALEPHQHLLRQFLLYRLAAIQAPEPAIVSAGLVYWQAQVERYRQTPYGRALADDVRMMQAIVEEAE